MKLGLLLNCPMFVCVGDGQTARRILKDPGTTKAEVLYKPLESFVGGRSIFTTNGDFWHSRRKGMAPAFSSMHVKRMNEVAKLKVDEWINTRLADFIENDQAFDVGEEMICIILSAISETAFQYTMSVEEQQKYSHEVGLCLKEFSAKTSMNPLLKIFGLFFNERRRAHLAAKRIFSLSLKIIDGYRQLENPIPNTVIDCIMKNDAYKNDEDRAADVTLIFFAGHDTTAYSIAWTLRELAKTL